MRVTVQLDKAEST